MVKKADEYKKLKAKPERKTGPGKNAISPEELQSLNKELTIRNTELRSENEYLTRFIGLISHELRTPLTVVTGAVKTALDERISPEDRNQLLRDAAFGAESLANMLENLLELSRYQSGRLVLNKETVNLAEAARKVVNKVCQLYSPHLVVQDIPCDIPQVYADPVRLERALYNLVENAFKYSSEGSEVRVFAHQDKEGVVIGVSDKGAGIALEDQKQLFEPFRQPGEGKKGKGAGLGLPVCKKLVQVHGGRIWVESKPGEGSTFRFTIPGIKNKKKV